MYNRKTKIPVRKCNYGDVYTIRLGIDYIRLTDFGVYEWKTATETENESFTVLSPGNWSRIRITRWRYSLCKKWCNRWDIACANFIM
jgi:hypothetical protein